MYIRTVLVSALFLLISCVSVQANVDTLLDLPSNTTSQSGLLLAQGPRDRRADRRL